MPEELILLRIASTRRGSARRRDLHAAGPAIAAAQLIELVLGGRLTVLSGRRLLALDRDVAVADATPTGDVLLDAVLDRVVAERRRTCARWISKLSTRSGDEYWDRLVASAHLRTEALDSDRAVADPATVSRAVERIRAVLAEPASGPLRDVALVTVLARTQSLFGLLHELEMSVPGLVAGWRDQRRDDRRGKDAVDLFRDAVGSSRPEEALAADAIGRIALAAEPAPAG